MSNDSSRVPLHKDPHCPPPPHPHPPCPPMCLNQEYVLSEGVDIHIKPGKEVNHDFTLNPNPFKEFGTLSGVVRDKHGKPIEFALVKVFDPHHQPITHVYTNREGQFLICIRPGHYIIKAVR